MKGHAALALALVAALAGCRAPPDHAAAAPVDPASPLESAAREANLVSDPATTPPTGLFERVHAAGRDSLCFTPVEGEEGAYSFGLTASFGSTLACEGRGRAEHDGAAITLRFADADCTIRADYDGQRVQLPGQVPAGCTTLCDPRGSLSGVGVQRVGWTVEDAKTALSRRDVIRHRPLQPLCN